MYREGFRSESGGKRLWGGGGGGGFGRPDSDLGETEEGEILNLMNRSRRFA